ncbi:arabinan endo-1,5-alpha-L-arabinosidase [Roseburia hominis]
MDGILRLNDYDVGTNAALGSHDPSMMWDPVSKKYYSYSTDVFMPSCGLKDGIGIPVRSSEDLVHFKYEGTVLSKQAILEGRDNGAYPKTAGFWAPYVEYVRGEYRMFYSATRRFGSSESRIWLATSKHPLGPFENRGVVMDTWGTDDTFPNAIDAHVIWEKEKCFLVYGSFFGGIYIKELDASTGLPKDGNPKNLGKCISRKHPHPPIDGPEGASVIYVPQCGYYYLFQSYGWLGDTYDIRVGRSKQVLGPYVDKEGRSLVEESMGVKLAGSYRFQAKMPNAAKGREGWRWDGLRGPGHGVPFYDPVSEGYFFVHHIRDGARIHRTYDRRENRNSYKMHYMMVRPMFFLNGWPVLSPEPYVRELAETVPKEQNGYWEFIRFEDKDNRIKEAVRMENEEAEHLIRSGRVHKCWDFENSQTTYAVTGFDDSALAYWGKFVYSLF